MPEIQGLISIASDYLRDVDLKPLRLAYDFVSKRHAGERHRSGETYVQHLLEVATTLATMKLDLDTIVAGILHGTIKEQVATSEELEELFGEEVAKLVSGATRITNVQYSSALVHQAENIRKLFLAMSADIRVLLIRLADRLQDMITLGSAPRESQLQIAQETMDLYAPLAARLGIDWMKRELEDLSFQYLEPAEYAELSSKLESSLDQRQEYVETVIDILREKLRENDIHPVRIIGRPKHLNSIFKKLVAQNIPLDKVYDKVAFRIILNNVKECYEALGTIHANWQPVQGRIKDFISVPKANNYQSLHTTVIGPYDNFIEIQIRTDEMDKVAQEGIAAHWAYKEKQKISGNDARVFQDLKKLVQSLQQVKDHKEFLETVRGELYEPNVFVLTPNGEVRELPRGSSPIDFAYSIHTAVGDSCSGARVNGQLVPLKHKLEHGDIVEIITQKNKQPKRAWLQIVKTSRARARIRQWLRKEEREKALPLGRERCERELRKHDITLKKLIKSGHIRLMLKQLRCNSLEDMLVKVGTGAIKVQQLVEVFVPKELKEEETKKNEQEELESALQKETPVKPASKQGGFDIEGVDGMLVRVSQCCKPVPGDEIVGFITTGRGVSIHKVNCSNLKSTDPNRWMTVSWSSSIQSKHRSQLQVLTENRKNILADIGSSINHDDADIISMNARITSNNLAEFDIIIEVSDLDHLQVLLQHLRQMPEVINVRRR